MGSDRVRDFYDEFMWSRMVQYRVVGNLRLDKAADRVLPLVSGHSRVLDVGCGIGIVTARIAAKADRGFTVGVDLSPEAIWYAGQTVHARNVKFLEADVVRDFDRVKEALGGPCDLVTMFDVIEHIPAEGRPALLRNIKTLCGGDARFVITYPSPQYQEHLRRDKPAELQIMDNSIALADLVEEAAEAGWHLRHYSLEDVWTRNQYVHAIFQTQDGVGAITSAPPAHLLGTVARYCERNVLVPIKRYWYITRVMAKR